MTDTGLGTDDIAVNKRHESHDYRRERQMLSKGIIRQHLGE